MKNRNHLIVKKYLSDHSLIESNIISFNEFINQRMQEIVEEINETVTKEEDFEIKLGKIRVGKPKIIEADGSSSIVMPYEARLRNFTYASAISLELTVRKGDQIDSEVVEIGKILKRNSFSQ